MNQTYPFLARVGAYPTAVTHRLNNKSGISLYPNPNNGSFSILGDGLDKYTFYELVNSTGSVVYKNDLEITNNIAVIANRDLPFGVYVLKLYSAEDVSSLIFQKQ